MSKEKEKKETLY